MTFLASLAKAAIAAAIDGARDAIRSLRRMPRPKALERAQQLPHAAVDHIEAMIDRGVSHKVVRLPPPPRLPTRTRYDE